MTDPRHPDEAGPDEAGPDDARLSELLTDAVSDVEPREALDSIRTRTKGTPMSARRPWTYAVGGAVVATAALIATVAFAGDQLGLTGSGDDGAPVATHHSRHPGKGHGSKTPSESSSASGEPSPSSSGPTSMTLAAYYLGETPQGTFLYREFHRVETTDPLQGALDLLASTPSDPDYRTPWQPGDLSDPSESDEFVDVTVADSLAERPAGMSQHQAEEAVQQVVYTLQAAVQSRKPVRFSIDTVLGIDTTEPVTNAAPLDVLAMVNITSPEEGATVSGSFRASGVASSFEATVPWELRQGDTVVDRGSATAEGWLDKLYPWQTTVDVSGLAPGTYTFAAMTDDPSGGEGGGPHVDTRTITVQ